MKPVNPALKAYVESSILPQYASVDPAHGPEHIRTVIKNSLELAENLDVDIDMVYAIAAYHDIGIRFGRENHEKTSAKLFLEDENAAKWFDEAQRRVMAEAIQDHRASGKNAPRSMYGRIVSEADRDIDPERIVRRTMEYGRAHCPELSPEEQIRRAVNHIEEKYGENGYLRLWLPCARNQEGLDTLRRWLKTGELCEICRRYS